jgi:hypothetical protein
LNSFATISSATIAEFNRLMGSSRCTRWHCSYAAHPALEEHFDFDRWITAGIKNLTCED